MKRESFFSLFLCHVIFPAVASSLLLLHSLKSEPRNVSLSSESQNEPRYQHWYLFNDIHELDGIGSNPPL